MAFRPAHHHLSRHKESGQMRKNRCAFMSILMVWVWLTCLLPSARAESAKNIIVMVADGMGFSNITAARIYNNGLDGDPLHLETLSVIGYQKTYSKNATITDSASAASAWACGEKFNNGEICKHGEDGSYPQSILELAKSKKKGTGLIATSTITHATPAAFGAHTTNRTCENEIARQYIQVTKPDVLLGGGKGKFNSSTLDACGTSGNFLEEAQANGYTLVYTKSEMEIAASAGVKKLLGLFNSGALTPEYQRFPATLEPRLPEMTAAALTILGANAKGFFLMIEGSQVDWGNHANHFEYQLKELLAFDEAVKVVIDWINENPFRKNNTLLIITSDHDTGGFAINGPLEKLAQKGDLNGIEMGWTSKSHTGGDTLIWSQGPGSKSLGKAIDNTEVYDVMISVLR